MLKQRFLFTVAATLMLLKLAVPTRGADTSPLTLEKDTHISIIGNTLADRMQHDGYFESLLYKAFPQQGLTVRDLGFSGDEVVMRARSANFGTPDEWLTKVKTDVVLAFFGFNESFGGPAGLDKFKADLDKFIVATQKQYYNGNSPARLVLFSPIAQEKLSDPNAPDPTANNANLKLYTAAMAEIARKHDVQFVDLFAPSQQLYQQSKTPLTFNGIHLTEAGYKALAPVMFKSLFGSDAPPIDTSVEKIRAAVQEKNEMWFSRYRTVDGYNIYGGRSAEAYQPGKAPYISNKNPPAPFVSNFQVMQEEMSQRDVMTANRDKRLWAVAQGRDLKVDDSNLPPVEQIKTNRPGPGPDGAAIYLSGQEAIKHMTTPKGIKINLWASEEQFPELIKPVQMAWDTKGRLWVASWRTYPERTPTDKIGDSILIFEDPGNVGHATKVTHFIDGLNCPTGFQFFKDGILLMQAPDLWFVRSTKGDDHADWKERVISGMDSADSHHTTNSMVLDPGGATYLSDGTFLRTQVETASGPVRNLNGCIYRYEPVSGKFERYAPYGFANPHGRVFDYWGTDYITDATGNANYFAPAFSGHLDYPASHPTMDQFWRRPSRPCAGTGILSSRAWPDEYNGNFLNCNEISVQGIFRVKLSEDGSGMKGQTLENLVSSDDPNFRPCQVDTGPDGAVYFADWANSLIGHLQHHLRDPNRDHLHGRIYQMTYDGRTIPPAKIDGQPIPALLALLKEPENDVRTRAKIELGKHEAAEVIAALDQWVKSLDKNGKEYEHQLTEALWVHQWHNIVDIDLLKQVLRLSDPRARAAATRVLCYWRDRVPTALALLKVQADDENPRVRLEAVRAASFFNGINVPEALEVAFEISKQPTDYYLDYTLKETLKQLQMLAKQPVVPKDPVAAAFMLAQLSDVDLARAPDTEMVQLARLGRKSYDLNGRLIALKKLAEARKTSPEAEFAAVLKYLDGQGASGSAAAEDLAKIMAAMSADELAKSRSALLALTEAGEPGVRRAAWVAIAVADAKSTVTWAEAKTDAQRKSLLESIGLLLDTDLRETFQPLLIALIADAKTPGDTRAAAMLALPLMGLKNAPANFALIAGYLQRGEERTSAARAIMQLPRKSWDKTTAGPVAESILAWAKTVPADKRTAQDFVETTQTGIEMASLLPAADATRLRKALRDLGVSVFVVKTVREQMRYDTTRLVVEAGKPFEVIMENLDAMPHNMVFVEPGTRQSVAEAVATMPPDTLDSRGRPYLPPNDKRVLNATKLLEPGQKETIRLIAPPTEGDYEYVCTFPGHWQNMYGTLIVTKDVDSYLQAHPVAPIQDAPKPGEGHVHAN